MPRFELSLQSPVATSSSNSSNISKGALMLSHPSPRKLELSSVSSCATRQSVRLCCSSPDGKALYSLSLNHDTGLYALEYQRLRDTLGNTNNDEEIEDMVDSSSSNTFRCGLPREVETALELSPPMELFCVESDSTANQKRKHRGRVLSADNSTGGGEERSTTLLCVYSKKNVFLLDFCVSDTFATRGTVAATTPPPPTIAGDGGVFISETEVFESYLLSVASTTNIVRIRPAPQRRMGYATLCPRGSMAMLTHDPFTNNYALVLFHCRHADDDAGIRNNNLVTTPLRFGFENLAEGQGERIVDFCFAQSNELSLLSSLTVLLLKVSGDVLAASPILFDGSVVPRAAISETLQYLETELHPSVEKNSSAKWRQYRAAQQFFKDAFKTSGTDSHSHFVTARVRSIGTKDTTSGEDEPSATMWPVKLHGPVMQASLFSSTTTMEELENNRAISIENFYAPDLVGFAVAGRCMNMEFGLVSPSTLVPRFDFESYQDGYTLDEACAGAQAIHRIVLRSGVGTETEAETEADQQQLPTNGSLTILRDPVIDSILHLVTPSRVTTVFTDAMRVVVSKIRQAAEEMEGSLPQATHPSSSSTGPIRTSVWSSLNVSSSVDLATEGISGATVSGNSQAGHMLFARLSNGSTVPINVTASRCLHEITQRNNDKNIEKEQTLAIAAGTSGSCDEALKTLMSMPPLYEVVEPLSKKVTTGLAGMGKIVGSESAQKDISVDMLAVAIRLKERCDKEVVYPLLELQQQVQARRAILVTMQKEQMNQLEKLKDMITNLNERKKSISVKIDLAKANASTIAHRSDALLQASQDLLPTITQAEHAYFQHLKRLERKCAKWDDKFHDLDRRVSNTYDSLHSTCQSSSLNLSPDMVAHCHNLLDGQKELLNKTKDRLIATQQQAKDLAKQCGITIPSDNSPTEDQ